MAKHLNNNYDICIATDWEYDADFLNLIEKDAHDCGLTTYIVNDDILANTISNIQDRKLNFMYLFDRASDSEPKFQELYRLLVHNGIPVFDSLEQLLWASDKATMHLEFIENGIHTPYTIILPPFIKLENVKLTVHDLAELGRPFIIKPANTTGGGLGVVNGAESLQDILSERTKLKNDKYLIQKKVIPAEQENRRFWFRGYYSCGLIQFSWWNDITHAAEALTSEDIERFKLHDMYKIVEKIAEICKLNFFSTEVVLTSENQYIVVDYVNESCDMRLKSNHFDGVPDLIVENISKKIAEFFHLRIKKNSL